MWIENLFVTHSYSCLWASLSSQNPTESFGVLAKYVSVETDAHKNDAYALKFYELLIIYICLQPWEILFIYHTIYFIVRLGYFLNYTSNFSTFHLSRVVKFYEFPLEILP